MQASTSSLSRSPGPVTGLQISLLGVLEDLDQGVVERLFGQSGLEDGVESP